MQDNDQSIVFSQLSLCQPKLSNATVVSVLFSPVFWNALIANLLFYSDIKMFVLSPLILS